MDQYMSNSLPSVSRRQLSLLLAGLVLGFAGIAGAAAIDLSPVDQTAVKESNDYYNIRVPNSTLKLALSSNLTVAWDSNVGRSGFGNGAGNTSGWYVQPVLCLGVSWPLTSFMRIHSSVGIGYRYYPDDSGKDDFFLNGDAGGISSGIEADLRLGQSGRLTIGDNISRQIDSLQWAATAVNDGMTRYNSTQNETYAQYQNDLRDDLHAYARYAHTIAWYEPGEYKFMNFQSDMIDTLLLKDFTKGWSVGPYATASTTYYSEPDPATGKKRNDSTDLRLGLALRYISHILTLDGRAGCQFADFKSDNGVTEDSSSVTPTYQFTATLNTGERITHTIAHSYECSTAYRGVLINYARQFTTTYQIAYSVNRDISLRGDVSWLNINESNGGERSDLLRFGAGPTYAFSRNTSVSLRYEYTTKSSDINPGYDRHVVSVTFIHKF